MKDRASWADPRQPSSEVLRDWVVLQAQVGGEGVFHSEVSGVTGVVEASFLSCWIMNRHGAS